MATDKKHIAVYLDKENEKSLMEYIKQHGGIKYSAAVNQILATFFGHSLSNLPVTDELEATIKRIVEEQLSRIPSISPSNISSDEVLERLSSLEQKLEDLSSIPETIPGNLLEQEIVEIVEPEQILSNIPGIRPSEVPSVSLEVDATSRQLEEAAAEKLEALVVEVEASEPGIEEPDSETTTAVEEPKPLSQQQLAFRLKCNPTTVYRARQKPESDFLSWSSKKDPLGIGWRFDKKREIFNPVV